MNTKYGTGKLIQKNPENYTVQLHYGTGYLTENDMEKEQVNFNKAFFFFFFIFQIKLFFFVSKRTVCGCGWKKFIRFDDFFVPRWAGCTKNFKFEIIMIV